MIDIIKGLFKTGDQIILICTDGAKIEGVIQKITDDVILLKNKNNLIKGVKCTMIEYFEQPENTTIKETGVPNSSVKKELKIIDKIPLDTLLQKDPRLRKRFPNLAKEQDAKKDHSSTKDNKIIDNLSDNEKIDRLIRSMRIDDAIKYIDVLLSNGLTPSKTKSSLLLKKAQVLSSLNRQEDAAQAYKELIDLNKKLAMPAANISHLYTELARLQILNPNTKDKAKETIFKALKYNSNNEAARNLLNKIDNSTVHNVDRTLTEDFVIDDTEYSLVPSMMIITDINEHKSDNPKIINTRQFTSILANELLGEAKKAREKSKSQSYLMFLDAAKVYSSLPVGSYDYQDYLYAMAYYAMLKADSLYSKYKNYSHSPDADVKEMEMLKDSACSYYRESLNLVSDVTHESLELIVTNYLKLEMAQLQASNGQRTIFSGGLKTILSDCILGGNDKLKKAAIRMILSCGAASVKVWNA